MTNCYGRETHVATRGYGRGREAIYGGTAVEQFDPCYHLACDTFDNISLKALDVNSDAIAYATLNYAMSTELINGGHSKGNFKPAKDDLVMS